MKKSILPPLLLAVLFFQITADLPAAPAFVPDFAHRHGSKPKKPKDCPATLYFTNGKRLQVAYLMELGDTSITAFVKYSDMKGGSPVSFPIRQISKIRIKTGRGDHLEGALVGAGAGLVPVGLLANAVASTDNCPKIKEYHYHWLIGDWTTESTDPACAKKHRIWANLTIFGGMLAATVLGGIRGMAQHKTVNISTDPQLWPLEKAMLGPFVKR